MRKRKTYSKEFKEETIAYRYTLSCSAEMVKDGEKWKIKKEKIDWL